MYTVQCAPMRVGARYKPCARTHGTVHARVLYACAHAYTRAVHMYTVHVHCTVHMNMYICTYVQ